MRIHWIFGSFVILEFMSVGILQAIGVTISVPTQIRFISPGIVHETTGLTAPVVKVNGISENFTIAGSASNLINIDVEGVPAGAAGGQTKMKCAYAGSAYGPCTLFGVTAPGPGKSLSVGIEPGQTNTGASGKTVIPTVSVIVTYQ